MIKCIASGTLLLFVSLPALAQRPKAPGSARGPVIELFGGYARTPIKSGETTVGNGFVGSFAWNAKSWLQIAADASYNRGSSNLTKNVLYGNHYGPRVFYHHLSRSFTPFAEALFGGSHVSTTFPQGGLRDYSDNGFSTKVGGGVDFNLRPHLSIRLFEVDLYRTSFFNGHQNTYWISSGLVLRLGGGGFR
ncbi:MAG TPA: outer membrane beta-barrel protein [Candidatus Dormibacteraeota bacterium]|nr:outer membrane beta-barrel protein [Candidatus Dormibacteraeota bacterium]